MLFFWSHTCQCIQQLKLKFFDDGASNTIRNLALTNRKINVQCCPQDRPGKLSLKKKCHSRQKRLAKREPPQIIPRQLLSRLAPRIEVEKTYCTN